MPTAPARLPNSHPPARYPSGLQPPRTVLPGRLVLLEPLDPARHSAPLFDATHGTADARAAWDHLATGPYPGFEPFHAWLKDQAAAFDPIFFAIRLRAADRPLGLIALRNPVPKYGTIEIGHVLFGTGLRRTAAATEAVFLLLRHVLDDLRYRRVEWKCDSQNATSHAAAQRLGFRHEGTFHQHMIVKGRNRDTDWYSILDTEWPAIRDRIAAWLAPGNFDAQGIQKRPLREMPAPDGAGP